MDADFLSKIMPNNFISIVLLIVKITGFLEAHTCLSKNKCNHNESLFDVDFGLEA